MTKSGRVRVARSPDSRKTSEAAAPRSSPAGATPPYAGRRALVVEADAGTRRYCADLLARLGFIVDVVETGVAAVTAARVQLPDVIIFNLQLRDVPGVELAGWLRSNPALDATAMIAISALSHHDGGRQVSGRGIDAVLRKPLSSAVIERAVRQALG